MFNSTKRITAGFFRILLSMFSFIGQEKNCNKFTQECHVRSWNAMRHLISKARITWKHGISGWRNSPPSVFFTGWDFSVLRKWKLCKWWFSITTGSFRKNGKSKTVFVGIKFHEKLIFSAFFSRELATNLRSWATRSVTITLWHPENVAPPVWFQALVGCLKPTTDPETLSKDHKGVLWSVRPPLGILWLY